jgi:hypothetical protein
MRTWLPATAAGAVIALSLVAPLGLAAAGSQGVSATGLTLAAWMAGAGLGGAVSAKARQRPTGFLEITLLGILALVLALAPLGAAQTSPQAASWFWTPVLAALPASAAGGALLARVFLGGNSGAAGNTCLAGALGAVLGGVLCLLAGFMALFPEFTVTTAPEAITRLTGYLSAKALSNWLMPGAGVVAAILAVAFGGGRGARRPVLLATVLGGAMQAALALGLVTAAMELGASAFGLPVLLLALQAAGLSLGVFAAVHIKIPALWVLAPLHGALSFVLGASLPAAQMVTPAEGGAYAATGIYLAAALAMGVAGGMHFALAARSLGGGLLPDARAWGLYLSAFFGGSAALAALTLGLVPLMGCVLSLKALALAGAGGAAALLLAVNRGGPRTV